MSHRSFLAVSAAVALALAPTFARAQAVTDAVTPTAPEIETSAYTFSGEVKADGVKVLSGANETDYPVIRVNKGTRLTVVGMKNDWLKIEPPEGAFCLVPQAFINKSGSGNTGRVIDNPAVVRIGSSVLPAARHKVPMRLDPGTEVQILGTDNEYYKIVPPKGVYLYVDKNSVDPVRRLNAPAGADNAAKPTVKDAPGTVSETTTAAPGSAAEMPVVPAAPQPGQPDKDRFVVRAEAPTEAPTTQQAAVADQVRELQEKLVAVEDKYAAETKKDISEQPIGDLLKEYEALLANPALPPNARRVAEFRASSLKVRQETLAQIAEAKKTQAEMAAKQAEMEKQRQLLTAKVAETQTKRYAAVGRLAPSSLVAAGQPLYRLVDPANGRTILYVRPSAGKPVAGLNQFVGLNGNVVKDESMKITYIEPETYETVSPRDVNKKVFAEYAPPSMATANLAAGESQAN